MSAPRLTDTDREALVTSILDPDDDCAHNVVPLFDAVEAIITREVAAAKAAAEAERVGYEAVIRESITQPHMRASTDAGPDYCSTCSEAVQEWVTWPCGAIADGRREGKAEGADEERAGWLHYFEAWASAVGAMEFTPTNVLRVMRGAKPWGCTAATTNEDSDA